MLKRLFCSAIIVATAVAAELDFEACTRSQQVAQKGANRALSEARRLQPQVGPEDAGGLATSVSSGAKLEFTWALLTYPSMPLRISNSVVFTSAPLTIGAYVEDSLIVSSSDISVGSYMDQSVVVTPGGVSVGSYCSGNVVDAHKVAIGSRSEGNVFMKVRPVVGTRSSGDRQETGSTLRNLFKF